MRFVLSAAVITSPGIYEYRLITIEEAREWVKTAPFTSAVGYAETAQMLTQLLGVEIPAARIEITMATGDEALVARLKRRVDPKAKGETLALQPSDFEFAILRKIA